MAATKSHARSNGRTNRSGRQEETPQKTNREIVEHGTEYVRHNPGYAALCCIGFVIGWKLKPW
jgi:hypothetical protein